MALLITCPDCEAENRVADKFQGKSVSCKTCGASFKVTDKAHFVDDPKQDSRTNTDEDDKPRKKKSSRTDLDDEDDDSNAKKKRRRPVSDADADERRGRARGQTRVAGNFTMGQKIASGVGSVFVIAIIVVLVILKFNRFQQKVNPDNNAAQQVNPALQQVNKVSEFDQNMVRARMGDKFALGDLQRANPNVPRRAEMAKAIEEALAAKDPYAGMDAARALAKWGNKDNVPAVIKALNTPYSNPFEQQGFQKAIIDCLGDLKDPQASKPLVDWVELHPDSRNDVSTALRKIGPSAEPEVQRLLDDSQDVEVRITGCKILKDIGTQASLPKLESIVSALKAEKGGKLAELFREANITKSALNRKK